MSMLTKKSIQRILSVMLIAAVIPCLSEQFYQSFQQVGNKNQWMVYLSKG